MAGYAASNLLGGTQQAMTTTYKTLINISASSGTSLQRVAIWDWMFGTDGTAADNAMVFDVSRTTAIGTGTSVTPNKLDAADGAFLGVATANHTAEPTVTANSSLWAIGGNQRATVRLIVQPGQELIVPATDAAGIAFRAKSPQGYTGTGTCQVAFKHAA